MIWIRITTGQRRFVNTRTRGCNCDVMVPRSILISCIREAGNKVGLGNKVGPGSQVGLGSEVGSPINMYHLSWYSPYRHPGRFYNILGYTFTLYFCYWFENYLNFAETSDLYSWCMPEAMQARSPNLRASWAMARTRWARRAPARLSNRHYKSG